MITPQFPEALYLAGSSLEPYTAESAEDIEKDPRGLVLMWEPPRKDCTYVMSMDPTEGITGWNRAMRMDGDGKTDNAAIEIFRPNGDFDLVFTISNGVKIPDIDPRTKRQRRIYKDVQVAEFAAPVDAVESARIANVLGRIYQGDAEDEHCLFIWEAWPGPGLLSTQELLRLGYSNPWMWQHIDKEALDTDRPGWRSTRESQKLLWYRSRRHLMNKQALIRSKHLLAEYANAEIDMDKMRARAAYGFHDDRFQAANMCFWAMHKWAYEDDIVDDVVRSSPAPIDYQRYGPGLDDEYRSWTDWKAQAVAELEGD